MLKLLLLAIFWSLSSAAVITVSPGDSIQAAIDLAQPGDTVELRDGEYREDVVTTRDGEIDKRITIRGSRGAILRGTGKENRLFQIHHDYISLDGFTLDGKIGPGEKEEDWVDKGVYAHGNRETRTIKGYGQEYRSAIDGITISNMKIINFGGECARFRYFVTNLQFFSNHVENCGVYDFVLGGMKAVNGETVYLGTSSSQIDDGKNPTNEIDQTRFIHIHHCVFLSQGNEVRVGQAPAIFTTTPVYYSAPSSELCCFDRRCFPRVCSRLLASAPKTATEKQVDAKEGVEYALIEHNTCSTQKDPNSACLDSRSDRAIFRYNEIHGNDGAAVRIGGHTVDGKVWGLHNEVYGNTMYDNKEGAVKLQTGAKEHPNLCENDCRGGCKVSGSASEGNEDIEKKCPDVMKIFWVDENKAVPVAQSEDDANGEPEDAGGPEPETDFEATVGSNERAVQASEKCFPVEIKEIQASSEQGKNTVHAAIDDKALTRWSAKGKGEWLEIDLAAPTRIDAIEISFFKGDERTQAFEVSVDGDAALKKQSSSGKTLALQRFPLPEPVEAGTVTITGEGNSENAWNSLTEVIVCAVEEAKPKPKSDGLCDRVERLEISKVESSADDGKNKADNVVDGDLETRWSVEGPEEQELSVTLDKPATVSEIGLAVYDGDKAKAFFDVLVETEEHGWEEVVRDGESARGKGIESYDLGKKNVMSVRVVCYGMEDFESGERREMNSFTEIELYGC